MPQLRLLPGLVAALAGAAVLGGCSSPAPRAGDPPASPSPVPSPSAGSSCADEVGVSIDVRDPATGAAFLVFHNEGDAACSLTGFPAVIAVDPEGGSVGNQSGEADDFGRAGTAVVLAPGGRAYAELTYTPAVEVGPGECGLEVPVRGFSVTAPGATQERFVDIPDLTFCTGEDWMSGSSVGPVDSEARAATA